MKESFRLVIAIDKKFHIHNNKCQSDEQYKIKR